ncbi:hypothetical protein M0R36_04380 [bacterium]|jgi:hypothetical protein|nr:hypothetical protein [bacterium]
MIRKNLPLVILFFAFVLVCWCTLVIQSNSAFLQKVEKLESKYSYYGIFDGFLIEILEHKYSIMGNRYDVKLRCFIKENSGKDINELYAKIFKELDLGEMNIVDRTGAVVNPKLDMCNGKPGLFQAINEEVEISISLLYYFK